MAYASWIVAAAPPHTGDWAAFFAPPAKDRRETGRLADESLQAQFLQKPGGGLVLGAQPGAVLRQLRLRTPTPGFSAEAYVTEADEIPDTVPDPATVPGPAWELVAIVPSVSSRDDRPRHRRPELHPRPPRDHSVGFA